MHTFGDFREGQAIVMPKLQNSTVVAGECGECFAQPLGLLLRGDSLFWVGVPSRQGRLGVDLIQGSLQLHIANPGRVTATLIGQVVHQDAAQPTEELGSCRSTETGEIALGFEERILDAIGCGDFAALILEQGPGGQGKKPRSANFKKFPKSIERASSCIGQQTREPIIRCVATTSTHRP